MTRLVTITALVTILGHGAHAIDDERSAPNTGNVEDGSDLTVGQMIAVLDGPQQPIPNLGGFEKFVELHLGSLRRRYVADGRDESALLTAMRDERRPIERRLCVASFLLDLGNESAQRFVESCLTGKHGVQARDEAIFVLVEEDLRADPEWRRKHILRMVSLGARRPGYDNAWDALCTRISEWKMAEAVDPLIGVLRRTPTDREAALALGKLGDPRAVPILVETIEHHGRIQEFHMYALRYLNAPQLPGVLLKHVDDYRCMKMLADLDVKEAIEPLQRLLATSADEYRRSKARLALARLAAYDEKDRAERLIQLFDNAKTGEERYSAIRYVGPTRQRWAVPKLLSIARTSRDSSVVVSAIEALGQVGGEEATAGLVSLFDHDFSHVPPPGKPTRVERGRFDVFIIFALRKTTGKDFGNDVQAWRTCLE
jgi:HEAT repeat protein